jgi:hypothetical protein
MLMLWMCCLSFAQEEKNELGVLLGAEFIPRAATTFNQKLSVGRSVAYPVDYARRLSSRNTALLLEFPFAAGPWGGECTTQRHYQSRNVICDAFVASPVCEPRSRIVMAIRGPRISTLRGK